MSDTQFHSLPFHSFLKEDKLRTGGMNQIFISTPTLSLVLGTHENGWEPVGTGDHLGRSKATLYIILSRMKEKLNVFLILFSASRLAFPPDSKSQKRVVP